MTDAADSTDLDALLGYLQRTRGFDFTAYKRPSLLRRIQKRLQQVGISEFAHYTDYLEVHPEEFANLFDVLLINVTAFFRDEPSWDYIRDEVLPSIVGGTQQIRIWSAGCASGEEPYSLVLAADEAGTALHVLATDVDPVLLERARRARYPDSSLRELPPELRRRAFDGNQLKPEYRARVEFAVYDLREGSPEGSFDVVLCRNVVFTYFDEELQREVAERLAASLRPGGALVVGAHETLPEGLEGLEPWSAFHGIYRRALSSDA
jgi:chemotaxis methyl-accepting protein methylase